MQFKFATVYGFLAIVLCPITAFAYIDPGTGSILIQGIIAAVAAIGVTLKLYWHRFIKFFRRGSDSDVSATTHSDRKDSETDNPTPRQ